MPELNVYQHYLIDEFTDDFKEKAMGRRELIKRVLLITGSVPATASMLVALGCSSDDEDEEEGAPAAAATSAPASSAPAPTSAVPTPPPPTGPGVTVAADDASIQVEAVKYKGPASDVMAYLARPRTGGPFPAIVIIHENRGLNEHTRDIARRYAKEGFVGLAVDLLSREGGTTEGEAENAAKLSANAGNHVPDLLASVDYLKSQSFVRAADLGVTGFCFGGGFAFELAVASPDIKAAVPYYGTAARILDQLADTNAALLAIYGGNDGRITPQAPDVEERLKAAGKTYQIKIYPGANHAFFNDTGRGYNEEAARDAWRITLAWFKQHLDA